MYKRISKPATLALLISILSTVVPKAGGQYVEIGCYKDAGIRAMTGPTINTNDMTTDTCVEFCRQQSFLFAGTQYASQCFCGTSYAQYGVATNCVLPCAGNSEQICGGGYANSVYKIVSPWRRIVANTKLQNHVIRTVTVTHMLLCAVDCDRSSECLSFNFHAAGSVCELNDAGDTATADAATAEGWVWLYYHP